MTRRRPTLPLQCLHGPKRGVREVAAKAVGEENGMMSKADWKRTTPEGGWEAKVVQMLEQRYDPNGAAGMMEDQFSPLHHAVRHDHLSMCKILLKHGADPNLFSSCGDLDVGPLHEVKSAAICQLLLDAGAEVNAIGASGNTALMMAAGRGNARIVRMLLKAGADPTIYDTDGLIGQILENEGPLEGETAAKTARRCGHRSLAAELDAAERSHRKKWKPPPPEPMPSRRTTCGRSARMGASRAPDEGVRRTAREGAGRPAGPVRGRLMHAVRRARSGTVGVLKTNRYPRILNASAALLLFSRTLGLLLEPLGKVVTNLRKDLRKATEEQVTIAAAALWYSISIGSPPNRSRRKDDTAILRHHKLRRRRVARNCAFDAVSDGYKVKDGQHEEVG